MLAACMTERAGRMRQPLNLASEVAESREAAEATLVQFGKSILQGLSDSNVLAVYRLAIAESARAPDIARTGPTIMQSKLLLATVFMFRGR
jgi:AefR-like transcriptional repressor, C-terminal domain